MCVYIIKEWNAIIHKLCSLYSGSRKTIYHKELSWATGGVLQIQQKVRMALIQMVVEIGNAKKILVYVVVGRLLLSFTFFYVHFLPVMKLIKNPHFGSAEIYLE